MRANKRGRIRSKRLFGGAEASVDEAAKGKNMIEAKLERINTELAETTEALKVAEDKLEAATLAANKAVKDSNDINSKLTETKIKTKHLEAVWLKNLRETISKLWDNLTGAISKLWVPATHYIVFFGVIFLLLYGFSNLYTTSPSFRHAMNHLDVNIGNMNPLQLSLYKIKMWFVNLFKWFRQGYSVKSALSMFDTNNTMNSRVSRDQMTSGRCDNMYHIDSSSDGTDGNCTASQVPHAYKFDIKPESMMPEWNMLPDKFKKDVTDNNKLTLYMPYTRATTQGGAESTFYVPQCDATYYIDKDGNKQTVDLYSNNELSCGLTEKRSTLYNQYKTRAGSGDGYIN